MTYRDETEAGIAAFATQNGLTREEAVARILYEWLSANGYLPSDDSGRRPDELNASNDD